MSQIQVLVKTLARDPLFLVNACANLGLGIVITTGKRHPSPEAWRRFLARQCSAAEKAALARHLGSCDSCAHAFLSQPAPSLFLCGRPIEPEIPILGDSLQMAIDRLEVLCRQAIDERVPVIAGAWGEGLFYTALSRVILHLRGNGASIEFHGLPLSAAIPPRPGGAVLSVLLEAPLYPQLTGWQDGPALITGSAAEWIGVPATVLDCPSQTSRNVYADLILSSDRVVRAASALCAFGCDIPALSLPAPFVALRNTQDEELAGWYALPDSWRFRTWAKRQAAEVPDWLREAREDVRWFLPANSLLLTRFESILSRVLKNPGEGY